jgi:hypothetical protein
VLGPDPSHFILRREFAARRSTFRDRKRGVLVIGESDRRILRSGKLQP